MDINALVLFVTASVVLIITPGPDVIFLITQTIHHGLKAGLATATGLASGNLIHTLAATFGLALLLQTTPYALTIIQLIGVCYLVYLATLAILNSSQTKKTGTSYRNNLSFFMRGLMMNILNPKVALFFLAFLPQFIPQHSQRADELMIMLGLGFTSLVIIIFSVIAVFSHTFKKNILLNITNQKIFSWLTASIFIFLSLHLLLNIF